MRLRRNRLAEASRLSGALIVVAAVVRRANLKAGVGVWPSYDQSPQDLTRVDIPERL